MLYNIFLSLGCFEQISSYCINVINYYNIARKHAYHDIFMRILYHFLRTIVINDKNSYYVKFRML